MLLVLLPAIFAESVLELCFASFSALQLMSGDPIVVSMEEDGPVSSRPRSSKTRIQMKSAAIIISTPAVGRECDGFHFSRFFRNAPPVIRLSPGYV
jgi:hypothetical protein